MHAASVKSAINAKSLQFSFKKPMATTYKIEIKIIAHPFAQGAFRGG